MYKMKHKTLLIIPIFIVSFTAVAQTNNEIIHTSNSEISIEDRLPSISELQEKAIKNSPIIKFYNAEVDVREFQIISEKRQWMRNMGVEGGAKYGLFDNLILTQDLGADELTTAKTEQTRYYFGAFVKIPLSSFADKSNVNAAKSEAQKMRYQKQQSAQELKKLVITQYYDVVRAHWNLLIKTNAVESYRVQMLRTKMDFENGQITVSEYTRLNDMLLESIISLEETKIDYQAAFYLLEETVGEKIELKNLEN